VQKQPIFQYSFGDGSLRQGEAWQPKFLLLPRP